MNNQPRRLTPRFLVWADGLRQYAYTLHDDTPQEAVRRVHIDLYDYRFEGLWAPIMAFFVDDLRTGTISIWIGVQQAWRHECYAPDAFEMAAFTGGAP